jgi:DNA polymerase III delta prime subunit
MESYASTARFILTCNYAHRIIPALKSRCHEFHINKTDRTEFTARAATVLVTENIDFDLDVLDAYVGATYPDLRKCLNQLQNNSRDGKLSQPHGDTTDQDAMLFEATELFRQRKIAEGRKHILQFLSLNPSRIEDIYRWMYNNLNLWSNPDAAIIIIRNGLVNLGLVAIPEICLAATMIELTS